MQNDENWESEIDWSRRTSVVGGTIFYEFIKAQALPTLDEGILALEAAKAVCEDKMRRWGAIAGIRPVRGRTFRARNAERTDRSEEAPREPSGRESSPSASPP